MQDWQERVVAETDELQKKFNALSIFIGTDKFKGLPGDEQERMQNQLGFMDGYLNVLRERIANFTDADQAPQ